GFTRHAGNVGLYCDPWREITMAQFYGIVRGRAKTQATREGNKESGLVTTAASWEGAVKVQLYEQDGVDYAHVTIGPWCGGGRRDTKVLYSGPINPNQEETNE